MTDAIVRGLDLDASLPPSCRDLARAIRKITNLHVKEKMRTLGFSYKCIRKSLEILDLDSLYLSSRVNARS